MISSSLAGCCRLNLVMCLNLMVFLFKAQRVVIKVGTTVVSNNDGSPSLCRIGALVEQCSRLVKMGKEVLLVYLEIDT